MKPVLDFLIRVCSAGRFFPVILVALSLLVSGCDAVDQDEEEKGGQGSSSGGIADDEDPLLEGLPFLLQDPNNHSIKEKMGVTETGTAGVTATFNALHAFLQKTSSDLADTSGAHYPVIVEEKDIRLGDWIDLEGGLTVSAHTGGGDFSLNATDAMADMTFNDEPWGKKSRLIVVGINSFRNGGYNEKSPYEYQGTDTPPRHIVFQFQNVPGKELRMNPEDTTDGGYEASEMRQYLTGNFLAGLNAAGVPENVLWAPTRAVSTGNGEAAKITDLLWLPTEREMFGNGPFTHMTPPGPYASDEETENNQARLEYYTSYNSRIKLVTIENASASAGTLYWMASMPASGHGPAFLHVCIDGRTHDSTLNLAAAPAFCVK
ncbi:MAG: DUF6273 domain-containing protein [Spirochaetaceae bacterium]|jgi:hypothetical protein|nr:DUF6273 domain-containing protein [Spirochaetaceae bacterium]